MEVSHVLRLDWFESQADLEALSGLDRDGLWAAGFNLDDWDCGFRSDKPLHRPPTRVEVASGDYCEDDKVEVGEGGWLLRRAEDYCVGTSYLEYGGWHWYLLHHA